MADPVAPAPLPPVSDMGLTSAAISMGLGLLVILAVILAAFWILRRFGPKFGLATGGRGGMLHLVSHLGIGPRRSVVVVRFLNRHLVLGVTDQAITLLTEGPISHEPDSTFAETLARAGDPPPETPVPR